MTALSFTGPTFAQATLDAQKSLMIHNSVAKLVTEKKMPGMIAAITNATGVVAIGSAGVRKVGSNEKLTDNDIIHLGSCTKAMTATMIATLVADGTLSWDTTLIDVFPELKHAIHPKYHQITLWQLLTHHAGLPENANQWSAYPKMEIKQRRIAILRDSLKEAPTSPLGEFHYSNLGYIVAACVAEKLTGLTWESLIKERLFNPLSMTSAGFGPPGSLNQVNQPWGHVQSKNKWQPTQFDNVAALGPAGRVHCTVKDWAKFISLQLSRNNTTILTRTDLDKLINPYGKYAGGWIVVNRPWAKGIALTHSGSNNTWYATVWVAPLLQRAYIAVTNSLNANSHDICDKMIETLIAIDRSKPHPHT